jgi:chitinase
MKSSVISALGFVAAVTAQNGTMPVASTTSTVYATSVYTITSCAATVTDCPARIGQVTTDIISLYTTVCPVTATEVKTTSAPPAVVTPWTISTIYSTQEYTILSCPPEVTNCPVGSKTSTVIAKTTSCPVTAPVVTPYTTSTVYKTTEYTILSCPPEVTNCPIGSKTTSVITSTTVCPVTTPVVTGSWSAVSPPVSVSYPAGGVESSKPILSTMTISTCVPSYYTTVITVTATPSATTPVCPGGANCPGMTTVSGTATGTGAPMSPKNSTIPYVAVTGGAGAVKVGGLMVVGLVAALL